MTASHYLGKSDDRCTALIRPVTDRELAALRKRLRLSSTGSPDAVKPTHGEDDFVPALSRRAIRNAALAFAAEQAMDNLPGLVLRRKTLRQFIAQLQSRSSAQLGAVAAAITVLHATAMRELGRPVWAGAIAALGMLLDRSTDSRRVTLSVYALSQAFVAAIGFARIRKLVPEALTKPRWYLLFALANAQLLHAFVFDPSTFPAAYSNFILRYSGPYLPKRPADWTGDWPSARRVVDGLAAVASHPTHPYADFASPLLHRKTASAAQRDLTALEPVFRSVTHPQHSQLACALLHPTDTACSDVAMRFVETEFPRVARFTGLLAALGLVIRWRTTIKRPGTALAKGLLSTAAGAAAVTAAIGTAWSLICASQQLLPPTFLPTKRFYGIGFLAGLAILFQEARAKSLGLYTSRMALISAWKGAVIHGRVRNIRNGDVLVASASFAILSYVWQHEPDAIDSGLVRRMLTRLFGAPAPRGASRGKSSDRAGDDGLASA